jgi:hypothetical protein
MENKMGFLVIDCNKRYEHLFNSSKQLKEWVRDNFDNEKDFYNNHLIYEVTLHKKYWDINDIK